MKTLLLNLATALWLYVYLALFFIIYEASEPSETTEAVLTNIENCFPCDYFWEEICEEAEGTFFSSSSWSIAFNLSTLPAFVRSWAEFIYKYFPDELESKCTSLELLFFDETDGF